jgi:hypothetical protein
MQLLHHGPMVVGHQYHMSPVSAQAIRLQEAAGKQNFENAAIELPVRAALCNSKR